MKRFKLTSANTGNYWWVYIYDTPEQLRIAADKFTSGKEPAGLSWADCYGVHHPFTINTVAKDGGVTQRKWVGIIRLARDYATVGIVAHELIHAALQDYRVAHKRPANFGWSDNYNKMMREEEIAYIYGALFDEMTKRLQILGIWKVESPQA